MPSARPTTWPAAWGTKPGAQELADYDPEALAAVFAERPALHRYPKSMAARVQALSLLIADRYDGEREPGLGGRGRRHRPAEAGG